MATSAVPKPKNYNVSEIKSFLLQPALTSHYEVYIPEPPEKAKNFIGNIISSNQSDLFRISCSEASLPGSSLTTHELNNDFTGVTQRHAYRRLYDDRIDFTFYVNQTYDQIRYFERWMQFIIGEQIALKDTNTFYRVNYPKDYKTTVYIQKFERTAKANVGKSKGGSLQPPIVNQNYTGQSLLYEFINAFPISINSMPVSYDSSQLLKCTVSFSYDRYIMNNVSKLPSQTNEPGQSPATGVPNSSDISYSGVKVTENPLAGSPPLSGNYFNTAPNQNNQQSTINPRTGQPRLGTPGSSIGGIQF